MKKRKPPHLKDEYKGEVLYKNIYHKSASRRWTEKEEQYLLYLLKKGYSVKEISEALNRTEVSVDMKRKRLRQQKGNYNPYHFLEKRDINEKFLEHIRPKSVLDLYCGKNTVYDNYNVTKNDINSSINSDYHMDALKCICKLYSMGKKYDLIDLDPFGSAYDCFDLAIKMANKGLCITLGEISQRRYKRLDYVSRYYDIYDLKEFNSDNLIKHIQKIGLRNRKQLKVFCKRDWNQISRVWFVLNDVKITNQWR